MPCCVNITWQTKHDKGTLSLKFPAEFYYRYVILQREKSESLFENAKLSCEFRNNPSRMKNN